MLKPSPETINLNSKMVVNKLRLWKRVIIFSNAEGDEVFMAIADENTQHIANMIQRQKSKKSRRGNGKVIG